MSEPPNGFITFCKVLRQPSDDPLHGILSATDAGDVVGILRLLRPGFASRNPRSGEPAEGLQTAFVDGTLLEEAGQRRASAAKKRQQQQQQQQKKKDSPGVVPVVQCHATDAAQVLLFDRHILSDGQLLHHAAEFMTLQDRLRRRERLLSSGKWSDGETLPPRMGLAPAFSVVGKSTDWQQLSFLLLASSGVWSRSMSADAYLRTEMQIGTFTGVFSPSVLFSKGMLSTLPPTAVMRISGMLSAALCRTAASNKQAGFSLFNKIVVSTIEHVTAVAGGNEAAGTGAGAAGGGMTPLTVARFLSDCRRLCSGDTAAPESTDNAITPLAVLLANACGVPSISEPVDGQVLFDSAVSTVGDEPPVIHVAGPLATPIQEVSFDVGGVSAGAAASAMTTVVQEPELVATLAWTRRIARAVWNNESAESTQTFGVRRTLAEWVQLSIAARIAEAQLEQLQKHRRSRQQQHHQQTSTDEKASPLIVENHHHHHHHHQDREFTAVPSDGGAVSARVSVPLVVPQNVQHITIDTSSGSDEDNVMAADDTAGTGKNASSSRVAASRPGTIAGRRLLQRALEVVFPREKATNSTSTTSTAAAAAAAGDSNAAAAPQPGGKKRGVRQYPTSLTSSSGASADATTSAAAAAAAAKVGMTSSSTTGAGAAAAAMLSTAAPLPPTNAAFTNEFAGVLASSLKNLRLVATADSASSLASLVGDARATSRLFNPIDAGTPLTPQQQQQQHIQPTGINSVLAQSWNRHRGYRCTDEHGTAETRGVQVGPAQPQSSSQQRPLLPPSTVLLSRYLGRCLEESVRHACAVSSAMLSHSLCRSCNEAPGQPASAQLKAAETTCSPGIWSVYAAISHSNELAAAARKMVQRLGDEEEHVRVSMNRAIGMSTLDQQLRKSKQGFASEASALDDAGSLHPRTMAQLRERFGKSEEQQRSSAGGGGGASIAAAAESSSAAANPALRGKPSGLLSSDDEEAGLTDAQRQRRQQEEALAEAAGKLPQRPKRRRLIHEEELLQLDEQSLHDVLLHLDSAQQRLLEKMDEARAADAEAGAALSRAEILVRERQEDLKMAEAGLAKDNEDYQRQLQAHIDEFVKMERASLHSVEKHTRHAWRLDDEVTIQRNSKRRLQQQQMGGKKGRSRPPAGGGGAGDDFDKSQQIDVDAFLGRVDGRFLFYEDDSDQDNDQQNDARATRRTSGAEQDHGGEQPQQQQQQHQAGGSEHAEKKGETCCEHNERLLREVRSALAQVEHSLVGVPHRGWAANVGAQLSIEANSVECPAPISRGIEWTHVVSLDAVEGGSRSTTAPSSSSAAAAALVDLLGTSESRTQHDRTLLPPPVNTRNLSTLTGESALYVVGTAVAVPGSKLFTDTNAVLGGYFHGRAGVVAANKRQDPSAPSASMAEPNAVALAMGDACGHRKNRFLSLAVTTHQEA